jgi:hypothetical protein
MLRACLARSHGAELEEGAKLPRHFHAGFLLVSTHEPFQLQLTEGIDFVNDEN